MVSKTSYGGRGAAQRGGSFYLSIDTQPDSSRPMDLTLAGGIPFAFVGSYLEARSNRNQVLVTRSETMHQLIHKGLPLA